MHDTDIATEFLRDIPPFSDLDGDQRRAVAGQLEAAYYRQGQTILDSSEAPGLALIRKGAVRLLDHEHRFLDQRSEGELFGHTAWFHGAQKPYLAEAEEDCLIWHLPDEAFRRLRKTHPALETWFSGPPVDRLSAAAATERAVTSLRELVRREPVTVTLETPIRDAAALMSREDVSSVLVLDRGEVAGIVTDKDLRQRVTAVGHDTDAAIGGIMTPDPMTVDAEESTDSALLLMLRDNYHHLPVLDRGRPFGLLTAGDILRSQSEHPLRLVRDIHRQDSLEELQRLSRRLPTLFERMVLLGREVDQVGRMVTLITDAFTVRLLQLGERELGPPPLPYAWVAFGSQARQEQTARTDQDNGMILGREPDGEEAEYFAQLARGVNEGLDRLGYVFCPGEIMALNPQWRVPLDAWRAHFDRWIETPEPKAVMHSSIFFDLRCVHGEAPLVGQLAEYACGQARKNRIFRRFMAANVLTHKPPIGFFRRFVQEQDGSQSEGLNLKHRGIVPIVDLARMRALEAGITEPNTFRRLQLAVEAGVMNEKDAGSLRDALVLISQLRLRHQCRQLEEGEAPNNLVPPEELSPLMRRNLKAAFMLVAESQQALAQRYQVH